ncbi:MAG: LytTR family DNA-binding domain-containing protein [Acidobacteriota bacterium]
MPQTFKTLIVDDERLARKELRSMLAEHPLIDIVGEAESVAKAIELIERENPDVVFLDIQMPGESGFDLLEQIAANFKTIFVTAFDAFALRAFEVNALDYLLKPINPERLARALERLTAAEPIAQVSQRKLEYTDRLFIEAGERSVFLKVEAIVCITAAGDYSEILTNNGQKSLVLKPLKEWEERLPEKFFTRIHRSAIVNLEYVERLESWFNQSYRVYLKTLSEPLMMSRRYAAKLKNKFS